MRKKQGVQEEFSQPWEKEKGKGMGFGADKGLRAPPIALIVFCSLGGHDPP